VGTIQNFPLLLCPDRNDSGLAALGPGAFQRQTIPLVRIAGYEFDGLLSSQPKGLLQLKTHSDVFVPYFRQIRLYNGFGLARVGHEYPVWNAVIVIGSCHDILTIHLPRPPAHGGHAVFDGPRRQFIF